jgi:alpha-glucoside transport system permease protein
MPDGAFVGLANYSQMFGEPKFWEAMRNNMLWLIVVPAASTAFGLLAAQLTDRISWGNIAKSLIFMPMAISFVGAAVIFKLIYDTRPADQDQIGVLNAVWLQFDGGAGSFLILRLLPAWSCSPSPPISWPTASGCRSGRWSGARPSRGGGSWWTVPLRGVVAGGAWLMWLSLGLSFGPDLRLPYGEPQTWLTMPFWNNFFLMVVLIWIQTGFAMVILSAALRGIPRRPSRRRSSTGPTRSRSSSRSRCRRSWAPSSWSGPRSR